MKLNKHSHKTKSPKQNESHMKQSNTEQQAAGSW